MRIAYPKVFPLTLLIVLGIMVWLLVETSSLNFIPPKRHTDTPDLSAFQVTGVRFDEMGQPSNKLTASELHHYHNNNATWFISPILVQAKAERATLTVTGVKAKFLQGSDELFMYDKVQLVREAFADHPKIIVNTANVLVNMLKKTVYSASPISAVAGKSHLQAVGFDFNSQSDILNLHQQLKVTYVSER